MTLPICCVTGLIAGDPDACGDCDPCGASHLVPEPVRKLLKELDDAATEIASLQERVRVLEEGARACATCGAILADGPQPAATYSANEPLSEETKP